MIVRIEVYPKSVEFFVQVREQHHSLSRILPAIRHKSCLRCRKTLVDLLSRTMWESSSFFYREVCVWRMLPLCGARRDRVSCQQKKHFVLLTKTWSSWLAIYFDWTLNDDRKYSTLWTSTSFLMWRSTISKVSWYTQVWLVSWIWLKYYY